jgi:hypothetical protein
MSVAIAESGLTEEPAAPEAMPDAVAPRGIALSVALHLVLGSLFIFGLPRLFAPPTPEEMPVAVELVMIAPETQARRLSSPPRPDAKPEVPTADAPVTKPDERRSDSGTASAEAPPLTPSRQGRPLSRHHPC